MTTSPSVAWTGNVSLSYNVAGGNGSFTFKPLSTASLLQELRAQLPPSFDYYVSSLNGNDANDGLTPATAKKTIMGSTDGAGAQSLLSAGKSLGLEYGSYFREQLTITWPNVRVGAYGVGELPVLDASDVVLTDIITKTAGQAAVYQFNKQLYFDDLGREFPFSTFENGQRLQRANSLQDCAAIAGSFYAQRPSDPRTQPWVIYLHTINSTDPATDGAVYEVAIRDAGLDTTPAATGLRLSNIHAKRSQLNDGVMRIYGKNSFLTACVAEDGTKHTLYVTDNCLLEDVICWKGEGRDSYFIYYYENGSSDSVGTTFRRCIAIGGYAYGQQETRYETASGYYCHSLDGNAHPLARVLYEDCYVENFSTGFAGEASQITIRGCFSHLTATAAAGAFRAGSTATIERNFFDQRAGAAYQKALNQQRTLLRAGTGTTIISHNVLLTALPDNQYGFCLFSNDGNSIIDFNHNTLLNEGNGNGQGLNKQGSGQLNFDHNIFYNTVEVCAVAASNQLTSSNNVYWRSNGGPISWFIGSDKYTTLPVWQARGQDAGSIVADPAFVIPSTYWRTVGNAAPSNPTVIALGAGATS